jgi:hypothetical protein
MSLTRQKHLAIRVQLIARAERERRQLQLIRAQDLWKDTLQTKIRRLLPESELLQFMECGETKIYATCTGCGITRNFFKQCNRKWCPRCQPRLSALRAEKIQVWAGKISQPKHLVLTARNLPMIDRKHVRAFVRSLARLRRAKCWKNVRGGCCSIEVTNEGAGWHLHSHLLLDVDWMDMELVRDAWAAQIGQETAIVKIKDVRGSDYLREVTKYAAKGSDLARWSGEESAAFIKSIKGVRLFFAFGSLFKMGAEIRREIARVNARTSACPCGCDKVIYQTEESMIMDEINAARGRPRRGRKG